MYARELTKEYLIKVGITDITKDGKHIYINDEEVKQYKNPDGYFKFGVYDHDIYKVLYPITKKPSAGSVMIPVHRAVYAWYHGSAVASMVVDHINNIKTDNRIENLQLLTPKENVWKDRECDVWELKCKLWRPRKYYEDKLNRYLKEYEQAKLEHNAKKVHKLRSYVAQYRARLRYWDSHHINKEN